MKSTSILIGLVLLIAMSVAALTPAPGFDPQQFRKYWNQGKAELTRYELKQARYGELHTGESVLIFVTEPFLSDKQVKYESGDKSKAIQVLKLNLTRKFYTGLYPYSMMTSVFTPTDYAKLRTLKVTTSSQEWCGHTFLQLNFRNNQYTGQLRSYFQDEGDEDVNVNASWLEDEIWTRIRLAPDTLPTGNVEMVPGSQYLRLWHQDLKPEKATATLKKESGMNTYTVEYANIRRKIAIQFKPEFPFEITAWEETQPGGFGDSAPLTTRAVKTKSIMLDYWDKNSVADASYRKQLGLTN